MTAGNDLECLRNLCDPFRSLAEADWWQWATRALVTEAEASGEERQRQEPDAMPVAPADGPGADAASVFAGMLAGLPLPDGDDGPFTGDAG